MKKNKLKSGWVYFLGILLLSFSPYANSLAQKAYFIDGYHGGVYGHYPRWQTQFMVDQLRSNPDWRINLEIEPETWDSVMVNAPEAYQDFKNVLTDPATGLRIEFVNPAYAQPYLYNISGESIIRQFQYGISKINSHFPSVKFTTYSSEEPCFTSALPQILKSLGFQYASLKNPNTCWGGYTRGFGRDLINWVGPDGTKIKTVPRYEAEELEKSSTWQTTAWANSEEYVRASLESGIKHPVGMCLQDAGWKGGPWLGVAENTYRPSEYSTWRGYFENIAAAPDENWNFNQEDVLVSLVWGSQVLQRLSQQIRTSENKIVMAEKLAAISSMYSPMPWPQASFDKAWRTLMLAQHHDCWIVPYNNVTKSNTWAEKVASWTQITNQTSDSIMQLALRNLIDKKQAGSNQKYIRIFNTALAHRNEIVRVGLPQSWQGTSVIALDGNNEQIPSSVVTDQETGEKALMLSTQVPPMGYATYKLIKGNPSEIKGAHVLLSENGMLVIDTDLYHLVIEPQKGGRIKSLVAKKMGNKEYVDKSNERSFNEIRGFFHDQGRFVSSVENSAKVEVLEDGPLRIRVKIQGKLGVHPFTQLLTLRQGDRKIDFNLKINWQGNPGIGKYFPEKKYETKNPEKAFYNDKYKLLALFPLNLASQKVYKSAPFDVVESKLDDTFFDRWDSIKNNVILHWVDLMDGSGEYGMALFTDHTTSYAHGSKHPLGLNLQYSGKGLWGKDYKIDAPLEIHYAIVPHSDEWDEAEIWTENIKWNEPLLPVIFDSSPVASQDHNSAMVAVTAKGWEATTLLYGENGLILRLFNAEGGDNVEEISFGRLLRKAEMIELNGKMVRDLKVRKTRKGRSTIALSIPRFGIRTIKLQFDHKTDRN